MARSFLRVLTRSLRTLAFLGLVLSFAGTSSPSTFSVFAHPDPDPDPATTTPITTTTATHAGSQADSRADIDPQQPNCTPRFILPLLPPDVTLLRVDALPANATYGEEADANPAFPVKPTGLPGLCAVVVRVRSTFSAAARVGNSTADGVEGNNSVSDSDAADSNSIASTHRVALFLPLPSSYRSRTLIVGNGGFAGGINYPDMAPGAHLGFATAASDTGHVSPPLDVASWAADADARMDWAGRAVRAAVGVVGVVVEGYYADGDVKARTWRYYSGCSNAGRVGLKAVSGRVGGASGRARSASSSASSTSHSTGNHSNIDNPDPDWDDTYTDAFDGILIGAPAWWLSHSQPALIKFGLDNLPVSGAHHVPLEKLGVVLAREVERQCDGLDGVEDGIVSEPERCRFDFDALACTHGVPGVIQRGATPDALFPASDSEAPETGRLNVSDSECFTDPQIRTLKTLFSDWVDPSKNDTLIHPGFSLGSEGEWGLVLGGSEPLSAAVEYMRYFVYGDPGWTWPASSGSGSGTDGGDNHDVHLSSKLAQMAYDADRLDTSGGTFDDFDLSGFREAGGKAILYQGLADGVVFPRSSDVLYERILESFTHHHPSGDGTGNGSSLQGDSIHDFLRYFKVPGMNHCLMTPPSVQAPWYFAGASQASVLGSSAYSVPGFEDERHDILLALAKWVEEGREVDRVVATTWVDQLDVRSGVKRQRPICAYPARAVWDGVGDRDAAGSWECKEG